MNTPPEALPGTWQRFFQEIAAFLHENAQGDVRCLVITETSGNQFWINGMVNTKTSQLGMLDMARIVISSDVMAHLVQNHIENKQVLEQQILKATKTEGKPQ